MIGKEISHYKILEKIGDGGMGEVYKALDTKLNRDVALKFLHPALTRDDETRQRFIREAQAASALDHNNICTIYEIGDTEDGDLFIAMGYYPGETLEKKIKRRPLPLDEAVNIASQISRGLAKAHSSGIVHRDIKPANIMVLDSGLVKILDFGLAKLTGYLKVTKRDSNLGTAAYMSPEQLQGQKTDHRTDIWSLGVVIYEMLTGQLPFKGVYEQAITYAILNEEPEPITALRTGVPPKLESIVAKAMRKEPGKRYQHVEEIPVDIASLGIQDNSITRTQKIHTRQKPSRGIFRKIIASIGIILVFWYYLDFWFGSAGSAVVVLLDTPVPERVYDPDTRKNRGTNADDLSDLLSDLPITVNKEAVNSLWHREQEVLEQEPSLIVIHRSCFYDRTNLNDPTFYSHLYKLADRKLVAFLGYLSLGNSETRFLVYSRGFSNGAQWAKRAAQRFPTLEGKILTYNVPGGDSATFRDPATGAEVKEHVKALLNLD